MLSASMAAAEPAGSPGWEPAGSGDVPSEHPAVTSAIATNQTADRLTGIPSGCLGGRVQYRAVTEFFTDVSEPAVAG